VSHGFLKHDLSIELAETPTTGSVGDRCTGRQDIANGHQNGGAKLWTVSDAGGHRRA